MNAVNAIAANANAVNAIAADANAVNAVNAIAANAIAADAHAANAIAADAHAANAIAAEANALSARQTVSAHSPLSRRPHRLLLCPECGGRLRKDKHPVIAETGTALRKRLCSRCGCAVHSRQLAEEITIVERPE